MCLIAVHIVKIHLLFSNKYLTNQCCSQVYFCAIWMAWVSKKCPKIVISKIFMYIVYIKTKWNHLEILLNKIFWKDANMVLQMEGGGILVSLNHPLTNFKKTGCSKSVFTKLVLLLKNKCSSLVSHQKCS